MRFIFRLIPFFLGIFAVQPLFAEYDPIPLNNLGVVSILEFRYGNALTAFEKLAKITPDAPELVQNSGLLMERQKSRGKLTPKQITRLVKLHAAAVEKHPDLFDADGPYKLFTVTAARTDCDSFFVQRKTAKNREPQPYEYKR